MPFIDNQRVFQTFAGSVRSFLGSDSSSSDSINKYTHFLGQSFLGTFVEQILNLFSHNLKTKVYFH